MPPWFVVVVVMVLIVGVFLGPFYEALRRWLGLQPGLVHVRELSPSAAEPRLPPKRAPKSRRIA